MKIYEIQRIDGPDETRSSSRLKFTNSAKFSNEVLPSLFKSREFIGGSVLWLESGYMCRSYLSGAPDHPLDVPIAICNSGFENSIAENIEYLINRGNMVIRNHKGEKFKISVESCAAEDGSETASAASESESARTEYKAVPVRMAMETGNESMFAPVEGYKPSSVKNL